MLNHSRAFNLAEKAEKGSLRLIQHYLRMTEKALAEAVETLVLSGPASQQLKQLFALSPFSLALSLKILV